MPLTEYTFNEENAVDRTFYGRIDVKKSASFLFYTEIGIVKNLIHYLKYRDQPGIGAFLGDWYGQLLREGAIQDNIDVVIPVPLHPKKLRKRGYNQVSLFAARLAHHLDAELREDLLAKTANTRTQTKKNRLYRWQAVRELYELKEPNALSDKNVLLVDDVITTGATLEACALALQQSRGIRIYIASMAVVP